MSRGEKSLLYVFVQNNGFHFVINLLIIYKKPINGNPRKCITTCYKALTGEIEKYLAQEKNIY